MLEEPTVEGVLVSSVQVVVEVVEGSERLERQQLGQMAVPLQAQAQ